MNVRVSLQEGFVLHIRSYRETSALVDVFTKEYGVVRLVARGMKRKSANKTNITQFKPLLFSWYGKSELKTLTKVEDVPHNNTRFMSLYGSALLKAICLNESIIKLLGPSLAYANVYSAYSHLLRQFNQNGSTQIDIDLLKFKYNMLADIGYGINFNTDIDNVPIMQNTKYLFIPASGFTVTHASTSQEHIVYLGSQLNKIKFILDNQDGVHSSADDIFALNTI